MMMTWPRPSIITLAGLRSRCSTPFSWAAARPAQSLRAVSTALSDGQASDAAQERAEVLAIHELHGDVVEAFGDADVVDAADVGVRHLARDADFVVEARQGAIVGGGGLGEELQGDGLAQGQVGGAIDLAHAAASQQSGDAVARGHHGAGQEAAFIDGAGGAEAGRGGGARSECDRLGGSGVERRRAGGAKPAGLRAFVRTGRATDHMGRSILARRRRGRSARRGAWGHFPQTPT